MPALLQQQGHLPITDGWPCKRTRIADESYTGIERMVNLASRGRHSLKARGATPGEKSMGSSQGRAGAVAVRLTGTGDAHVYATGASANQSDPVWCLVPPPPR